MRRLAALTDVADRYDLLVVGAGPAGLSATAVAASLGLSTILADDKSDGGGPNDRARSALDGDRSDPDEDRTHPSAVYAPETAVWTLGPLGDGDGFEAGMSRDGASRLIRVQQVVDATGTVERPFPIPGWTLPGVITGGAATVALRTSGLAPEGRVVLAGCGPLLYGLAAEIRAAGATIVALLDTTPRANWHHAALHAPDFLRSPYLVEGIRLVLGTHRGIRVMHDVTALSAEGVDRVTGVAFKRRGGAEERFDCDRLVLHQGVVPAVNLSSAAGCRHRWDRAQLAWLPEVDPWFESSVPGLAIAGDAAGIGGTGSAVARGALAAIGAAARLGRLSPHERDARAGPIRRDLARANRGRRFIDFLYRPAFRFRVPPEADTVVCRGEGVTAGQIREAIRGGVTGPDQVKSFLRCGMGACQGRLCSLTLTELIAAERGLSPAEIGAFRLRSPVRPIPLRELAALAPSGDATGAGEP